MIKIKNNIEIKTYDDFCKYENEYFSLMRSTFYSLILYVNIIRDSDALITEIKLKCPRCGKIVECFDRLEGIDYFINFLKGDYKILHKCKPLLSNVEYVVFTAVNLQRSEQLALFSPLDNYTLERIIYNKK